MDFNITPLDVGISVVQELWNKLAFSAKELVKETQQIVLEKDSFQDFSKQISHLNIIFQSCLHSQKVEAAVVVDLTTDSELITTTTEVLETLNSQLRRVRNLIRDYKSCSKLRLVFKSHTFLKQMRKLSNEIAHTVSTLNLANLDATLNVKSEIDQVINNLRLIEFKSAGATEAIASDIEKSMLQNERNRDRTVQLLQRIAEAVGAKVDETLVRNELELLKQEKEELELQKKKAEAFHLSQLIQFLYSSEIVSNPQQNEDDDDDVTEQEDDQNEINTYQQSMIDSFTCPLCKELMKDPVALFCGHSFERRAIEEHFSRGQNTCPTCKHQVLSLELTPNVSLLNSIEEWNQREMDLKFQSAISGITSDDHDILNRALQDLQGLMEVPHYRAEVSEKGGLIPIIVEILKANVSNTKAALKCLYYLSSHCDHNKEAIVEARAIPVIVKYLYRGGIEPDAVAILLELSLKETIGEQIGNAKYCIPVLVSLLNNNNQDVSQKAQTLLQNLSSHIDFVIKMAEAGHFKPFVDCFKQGSLETRALMATSLINIQLGQNSIKEFENKRFTRKLVQMLSSRSPVFKSDCLKCIKKFLPYPKIVKSFLADTNVIPLLINLISSSVDYEETCKQAAIDVLASLVESTPLHDFQTSPHLQELQSKHISLFLDFVTTASDPQLRARSLQILLVLSHKSEITRNSIRDDEDAVASLYSAIKGDQPEVRRNVMELIYCVSKDHPAGVPLPVSPAKESAINFLVTILTSSPDIKERSFAATIISRLSNDDIVVDNILRKSEALKAIQEVICTVDHDDDKNVHGRIIAQVPIYPGESSVLLEESLAALLRYTHPTKPELQKQVIELQMFPSLVRVLSRGSSLAKQRAAMALAHLSEATNMTITDATLRSKEASLSRLLPSMFWWCSVYEADRSQCSVHGSTCSPRNTFCLVKADAVRPLVQTLSETKSGAAEAALIALETLLTGPSAFPQAAAIIVDNQGVAAILEVLEKGSLSAKDKALDIFDRILQHIPLQNKQSERSERIIIHLLSEEALKRKAASVLKHMNLLPDQSSYF